MNPSKQSTSVNADESGNQDSGLPSTNIALEDCYVLMLGLCKKVKKLLAHPEHVKYWEAVKELLPVMKNVLKSNKNLFQLQSVDLIDFQIKTKPVENEKLRESTEFNENEEVKESTELNEEEETQRDSQHSTESALKIQKKQKQVPKSKSRKQKTAAFNKNKGQKKVTTQKTVTVERNEVKRRPTGRKKIIQKKGLTGENEKEGKGMRTFTPLKGKQKLDYSETNKESPLNSKKEDDTVLRRSTRIRIPPFNSWLGDKLIVHDDGTYEVKRRPCHLVKGVLILNKPENSQKKDNTKVGKSKSDSTVRSKSLENIGNKRRRNVKSEGNSSDGDQKAKRRRTRQLFNNSSWNVLFNSQFEKCAEQDV